jgi:hypothetical protein
MSARQASAGDLLVLGETMPMEESELMVVEAQPQCKTMNLSIANARPQYGLG